MGYIRLSSFISKNATTEFENALNQYKNKKGFIIDLRSNPGGLLSNAILISDMFLDGGIIVSTVDRDGYKETTRATKRYVTDKPIVTLSTKARVSKRDFLGRNERQQTRITGG